MLVLASDLHLTDGTTCANITPDAFSLLTEDDFAAEIPMPIGSMIVANLTPGGILADRTDGELFRTLRYGYGKHVRAGMMTFMPYRQLSDEDTEAIIAFLRSQEPVKTEWVGGDSINILGAILLYGLGVQPLPETTKGVLTAPPMAWKNAAAMSDDDLTALHTYLRAAP